MSNPYDFGSIPGTLAEYGGPPGVPVIADEAGFAGCLLNAKLIGAVRAGQDEAWTVLAVAEQCHEATSE